MPDKFSQALPAGTALAHPPRGKNRREEAASAWSGQFQGSLQELSAHSHSFFRTPTSPHLNYYTVASPAQKTSGCSCISGTLTTCRV